MAERMVRNYKPSNTPIQSLGNLLFAVEEAVASPKISIYEAQLGSLILATLEMQMPYLEEAKYRR